VSYLSVGDFGAEEQVHGRSWEAGAGEQLNAVKV
jgi:hypothetical protein